MAAQFAQRFFQLRDLNAREMVPVPAADHRFGDLLKLENIERFF